VKPGGGQETNRVAPFGPPGHLPLRGEKTTRQARIGARKESGLRYQMSARTDATIVLPAACTQVAVIPPSMTIVCPVVYEEASDRR
jgi:hypothetical protein